MIDELREFTGETVEAATASAASHFGVPESQLDVKVVPHSLGVAGLGARTLILAMKREVPDKTGPVSEFIQHVLEHLNATARLRVREEQRDGTLIVQLESVRVSELMDSDPNFLPSLAHLADRAATRLIGADAKADVQVVTPRSGGGGGGRGRGGRERGERGERGGRGGRGERGGRGGRPERSGGGERSERGERGGRSEARGRDRGRDRGLDGAEREAVERYAREVAEEVLRTGEPKTLRDMNSKERWVVHNTVRDIAGVRSESIGEDPEKRVQLSPE